jgi:hypothetical protein
MISNLGIFACKFKVSGAKFDLKFTRMIVKQLFLLISSGVKMQHSALIGHIKGFCLGRKKDYLKISFVSDKGGVDMSGFWLHESDRIALTLNVIIIGVRRQELIEIVNEAVKEIEIIYLVKIMQEKHRLL